jgi:hypothetical protein
MELDETGLNTDSPGKRVNAEKGSRDVYQKSATCGKTSYSVLVCGSTAGKLLPLFVIYKGSNLWQQWMVGGPPGTGYGCSPSGWMHDFNFEEWFNKMFVPHVHDLVKPCLLLFDGHNSHITWKIIKNAMDNDIIIICLPPHSSHHLQPLDVGFFASFKVLWRNVLREWASTSRYQPVTKAVFPTLLNQVWETMNPKALVGGFRGSGLFPCDREVVLKRIATTTKKTTSGTTKKKTTSETDLTPRKVLIQKLQDRVTPEIPSTFAAATANQRKGRKCVQAKIGEILTEAESAERLRQEEESRNQAFRLCLPSMLVHDSCSIFSMVHICCSLSNIVNISCRLLNMVHGSCNPFLMVQK